MRSACDSECTNEANPQNISKETKPDPKILAYTCSEKTEKFWKRKKSNTVINAELDSGWCSKPLIILEIQHLVQALSYCAGHI